MDTESSGRTCDVGGRSLHYSEYGDSTGAPVLFFHGTPGCRLLGELLDTGASDANVRLLVPERPGIGRSDPMPDRTLLDWTDDVAVMLDALSLGRVGIVGYSGGGPHALACASDSEVADRLTGVGLLAGVAPPSAPQDDVLPTNRVLSAMSRSVPWLVRPVFRLQTWLTRHASPSFVTQFYADRPVGTGPDEIDPAVAELVYRDFLEAFDGGVDGVVRELALLAEQWPFDVETVDIPVKGWYGGNDVNVPVAQGEFLTARLPDSELTVAPEADHLSVLTEFGPDALGEVAP
ncbi:alpha/beta fold hydrolase [Halorussus amylolyticus]|uniref:alpha/beta fold hydrolase n=1 Tax=Halorussus amylolyticus TaxID=1126242 RepID=UPI0010477455|nr:alpha/beta hydrolase [Halorussus amylolyticus]